MLHHVGLTFLELHWWFTRLHSAEGNDLTRNGVFSKESTEKYPKQFRDSGFGLIQYLSLAEIQADSYHNRIMGLLVPQMAWWISVKKFSAKLGGAPEVIFDYAESSTSKASFIQTGVVRDWSILMKQS